MNIKSNKGMFNQGIEQLCQSEVDQGLFRLFNR